MDGQQRNGQPEEGGQENSQDFPGIARQYKSDELADIVVNLAPLAHSPHHRREIVVEEDDISCFLRYIGSGDAHGDAYIGAFEGGRIIDPVAGHSYKLSVLLKGADNPELLFRGYAGIDTEVRHSFVQFLIRHFGQRRP